MKFVRFFAPLVAADIDERAEEGGTLCWVYKPVRDMEEAYSWAKGTLTVHMDAPSDEDFILTMSERLLPYEPLPSHKQYLGVHLLLRASGEHSVYTHGTHAILDARPNFQAFRHFFQALSGELDCTPLTDLLWGAEVKNLPVDIVTIMGGVKTTGQEDSGLQLPDGLVMAKVRHIS